MHPFCISQKIVAGNAMFGGAGGAGGAGGMEKTVTAVKQTTKEVKS